MRCLAGTDREYLSQGGATGQVGKQGQQGTGIAGGASLSVRLDLLAVDRQRPCEQQPKRFDAVLSRRTTTVVFQLTQCRGGEKTQRMHAVVATVRIEDVQVARDALAGLRLNLVPRAPGFAHAYWLAPVDRIGMSLAPLGDETAAGSVARSPAAPAAT